MDFIEKFILKPVIPHGMVFKGEKVPITFYFPDNYNGLEEKEKRDFIKKLFDVINQEVVAFVKSRDEKKINPEYDKKAEYALFGLIYLIKKYAGLVANAKNTTARLMELENFSVTSDSFLKTKKGLLSALMKPSTSREKHDLK